MPKTRAEYKYTEAHTDYGFLVMEDAYGVLVLFLRIQDI